MRLIPEDLTTSLDEWCCSFFMLARVVTDEKPLTRQYSKRKVTISEFAGIRYDQMDRSDLKRAMFFDDLRWRLHSLKLANH